jgi:hypothetical protein
VLPDDLWGMAPERSIEFKIELQPTIAPIAKAPYKMTPIELAELIIKLQDLQGKCLIHPSSSLGVVLHCSFPRRIKISTSASIIDH